MLPRGSLGVHFLTRVTKTMSKHPSARQIVDPVHNNTKLHNNSNKLQP